jgi:hypothetical protein
MFSKIFTSSTIFGATFNSGAINSTRGGEIFFYMQGGKLMYAAQKLVPTLRIVNADGNRFEVDIRFL